MNGKAEQNTFNHPQTDISFPQYTYHIINKAARIRQQKPFLSEVSTEIQMLHVIECLMCLQNMSLC